MGWQDLEFRERWSLIVSTIQAVATAGAMLVAVVGIWRVAPIITYQVEKQRTEPLPLVVPETSGSPLAKRFADEALAWWSPRVATYDRIVELVRTREKRGTEIGFELIGDVGADGEEIEPGVLVVTADQPGREAETLRVEVNEQAMQPALFIQRQINTGFFEGLDPEVRRRVEAAVESYSRSHMLPRIPAPHLRADMSLDEIANEISHHRDDRLTAARQIPGLVEIIEDAIRG